MGQRGGYFHTIRGAVFYFKLRVPIERKIIKKQNSEQMSRRIILLLFLLFYNWNWASRERSELEFLNSLWGQGTEEE